MSDSETKPEAKTDESRRAALKKLGKYAAYSAPLVAQLMAGKSASAGAPAS